MITRPTTFVLGAGVSQPFGFPSGLALCELLAAPDLDSGVTRAHEILVNGGFADSHVRQFAKALRLSGRTSVDAFLEHRPDFLAVGKAAIAASLIPYEKPFALFRRQDGMSLYDYIWSKMNAKPSEFAKNRASFITFNYDRSLEHFLSSALSNTYGISDDEMREVLKSVSINHLHGTLGVHPACSTHDVREYEPIVTAEAVKVAASGLRVIHEQMDGVGGFENARITLQESESVVFLGFGYDATNLSRLKVREIPQRTSRYGTAYGLTELEQADVRSRFADDILLGDARYTALAFLRECVLLR